MRRKTWLMPFVVVAALLAGATSAEAAKTLYPPQAGARDLNSGAAGWVGSSSSEGLCVPLVLCPAITNSVPSSGGQDDSGYLDTSLGSLLGVGATSIGTFTGPEFTYDGVKGEEPNVLEVDLVRKADVEALLSVAGNSATFSVRLVDTSGGADVTAIPDSSLAGATSFSRVPSGKIDPSDLKVGHTYRIEISTRFETGTTVVPGGMAGYDNVVLKARTTGRDGNGGHGGHGGNGGNGQNGQNGLSGADAAGGVIANKVRIKGKFVVVKVKCSRHSAKRKCKSKLNARLSRKGPQVTSTQRARVKSGRADKVKLRIKGKYRDDIKGVKRLTIKRKTRVAGKVKTTYKSAKVKG
jgi:hypothetical protein